MSNNIKSLDLCFKCKFGYINNCIRIDCCDCERDNGAFCECNRIQPNTPCPFFAEQTERPEHLTQEVWDCIMGAINNTQPVENE